MIPAKSLTIVGVLLCKALHSQGLERQARTKSFCCFKRSKVHGKSLWLAKARFQTNIDLPSLKHHMLFSLLLSPPPLQKITV